MSEDIKEGDLVQVIKAKPCGCTHNIGLIFKVSFLEDILLRCIGCDHEYLPNKSAAGLHDFGIDTSRLKKIPPLSDDESTETSNDLVMPVKEVV